MEVRLAASMQPDSFIDGKGIRTVIWFQGCLHNCVGCHNPETHDLNGGFSVNIDNILKEIKELKYQDGITLSGGDPFFQPEAALKISKYAHSLSLNVWAYTGYTFETLNSLNDAKKELLKDIDVLVDGKFVLDKKSLNCKFRGSTNQRIIDVKKSLKEGKVIEYEV